MSIVAWLRERAADSRRKADPIIGTVRRVVSAGPEASPDSTEVGLHGMKLETWWIAQDGNFSNKVRSIREMAPMIPLFSYSVPQTSFYVRLSYTVFYRLTLGHYLATDFGHLNNQLLRL